MVTRFRIRQLIVIATVVISLIFIYNAYSGNDVNEEAIRIPEQTTTTVDSLKGRQFNFKIVISGQDGDRQDRAGGANSAGNAADSFRDQKCKIPKLEINGAGSEELLLQTEAAALRQKSDKLGLY
ncbi:hypothetical protein COOONC_26106 [Cooperia oncophora]